MRPSPATSSEAASLLGRRPLTRARPPDVVRLAGTRGAAGKLENWSSVRLRVTLPRRKRTLIPLAALATTLAVGIPVGLVSTAAAQTPAPPSLAGPAARDVDRDASLYAAVARVTVTGASGKVDASALGAQIDQLTNSEELPAETVAALTANLRGTTSTVADQIAAHDAEQARIAAEQAAQAAAQEAAAKAAAEKAAAAKRAAASQASAAAANAAAADPASAQAIAKQMAAANYGWGDDQFACLYSLWKKESGWNYRAYNASSGAYGIPQALPGSKMGANGADWQTNPATQIAWGLGYISRAYGTPCGAWGHSQSTGWY